jgi:hypothetical protein
MIAAAALVAGTLAVAPANAVPTLASKNVAEAVKPAKNPYVSEIRYRGHRFHRHHHHGGDWGPWVAGSLLGLGLGYALSDGYGDGYYDDYGPRYYYRGGYGDGGFARCEATFKSFDPDSGTYMGYDGRRHRCPYI